MNHYHSDHITEDKEARIQERIEARYKRACEVQEERYFRLWKMEFGDDFSHRVRVLCAKSSFLVQCLRRGESPYRRWSEDMLWRIEYRFTER